MNDTVTIAISHFVKPGKEEEFEKALKEIILQAKNFEGYQGIQIIRPNAKQGGEYLLLVRFDTDGNYRQWENSTIRKSWSIKLQNYVRQESRIRYQEGLEFWFSSPQTSTATVPSKWKMAVLTWSVIYPLILVLSTLAGAYLDFLHPFVRMLIISALLVSSMTYFLMPEITRIFAKWIFKGAS